jgi:dihydroorotate dehydrogenase
MIAGAARGPQVHAAGLTFASPVGVSAGVDPSGRVGRRFGRLGFGFAEVGSVTLRPEPGRAALDDVCANLARDQDRLSDHDRRTMLGAVVAAGREGHAARDILICLERLAPWVDYVTLTLCGRRGRPRWTTSEAEPIIQDIARGRARHFGRMPLLVKLPATADCARLVQVAMAAGYSAAVVENGGRSLIAELAETAPVIAVGQVRRAQDVSAALGAGACLVQVCRPVMRWGPFAALGLRI